MSDEAQGIRSAECDFPGCTRLMARVCGEFNQLLVCDEHVSWAEPEVVPGPPSSRFEWMTRALWEDGGLYDELFKLMEDRHAKYGAGNISRRGVAGILVRLDDKLERLSTGTMDHADESYRDAWLDVVNYGLIALMVMDGVWPSAKKSSETLNKLFTVMAEQALADGYDPVRHKLRVKVVDLEGGGADIKLTWKKRKGKKKALLG